MKLAREHLKELARAQAVSRREARAEAEAEHVFGIQDLRASSQIAGNLLRDSASGNCGVKLVRASSAGADTVKEEPQPVLETVAVAAAGQVLTVASFTISFD